MTPQDRLFPIFLKLSGRPVVVVGAGAVAASKLHALLEAGAEIHVVAPQVHPDIDQTRVRISQRAFRPTDLDEAWLAVAAAPPDVNRQVAEAAERRQVFVNAVDDVSHASAYLGGVTRRAGVTVAISTDGEAPALAGLLREGLDAVMPETDLEAWVTEAKRMRERWRHDRVPMNERRPQLLQALMKLKRYDIEA